ncbi:MAG: hypothetical protein IPP15_20930 [Saprospiraceae bacterium]|uniref:Uncharacterized protein n=1 Tax=Candidatus Opimibacter skivensis TaxID=2982028 RepID=A0A9D7SZ29_9BACT|nr:hypothetical protein [Candidatus Opimibacter skivensis]
MKYSLRYTFPILFILTYAGCKEKVTQEQLINAAIEIKLAQWREAQIKSCDDKILEEAEKYVDSVLVAISLETKLDTITKPEKPVKPIKPAFKEKPDSVVVEKIYKKGG